MILFHQLIEEAEKIIIEELQKAHPEYGIITTNQSKNKSNIKNRWIIDPIDGTRSFVNRYLSLLFLLDMKKIMKLNVVLYLIQL